MPTNCGFYPYRRVSPFTAATCPLKVALMATVVVLTDLFEIRAQSGD